MTKHELIQMMGNEDNANWVMERILECVKKDFVRMCLKDIADKYEAEYKTKEATGYYTEFSHFQENFNLWTAMANGDPLAEQYDNNEARIIERSGDEFLVKFSRNMWVHAMNH